MQDKFHLTKEQNLFLAKNTLALNIYNSARLEGINTTYPDTQTILEGVNVPTLKLDEINCILNLRDAWNYTLTNIDAEVNLDFICKVNSFVSRNESLEWGVLRNGKVGINGVDYIPDIPNRENVITNINEILKEEIKSVLMTLQVREQEVLELRFGLVDGTCHTLEEVGKKFNVTRERIRQIEATALRKLKHPSRSRKLRSFLDS